MVIIMVDHTDDACTLRSLLAGHREHEPADYALRVMKECCLLALRESAHGCLQKASSPDTLVTALRAVTAGELWAGPSQARHWLDWWQEGVRQEDPKEHRLAAREIEVIGLVVDGMSNSEITVQLGLKEQTVKNHIARILNKLGVRNPAQPALRAVREHIA